MGARGKAPMPQKLRLLTGDHNSNRYNPREPEPRTGKMIIPKDVSPEVARIWRERLPELEAMGLAFPSDIDSWRAYCEAVALHEQACRELAHGDMLVPGQRGMMRNPLIQVQRDAALTLLRFATHFGLTPSARSSVMAASKDDNSDNPFAGTA
jgi:P27 family predicted phage terminase small subunit